MATHPIHWGEGLFLRPHHFQIADRWIQDSIFVAENWNVGYAYGLRKIEIDADALLNWRVSLSACHIRLQDGTHLRYPENAVLAPVPIPREAFANPERRARVYLALPRLHMGRQNAAAKAGAADCRYLAESIEVEDENQPGNPQPIDVRWLNARLVVGGEEAAAGYEALPIMQLRLTDIPEAPPQIDPDFIPPLLACDAWASLQKEYLTGIYDHLSGVADRLAQQMIDRGVAFESGHREDFERILKLHAVNTALGYVSQLPFARGIHPFVAYSELCRVVGLIAIFHPKRKMPPLPLYDHDDLGKCFRAIREQLQPPPPKVYFKRPFICAGRQMQVRIDREWLEPSWEFYVGVECQLAFTEVQALLLERLQMKVGASDKVEVMYRHALSGVRILPEPSPPRDFPRGQWSYWKVDRACEPWEEVEKTLDLGIRFNERQVEGWTDGESKVRIQDARSGDLVNVEFALFARQLNTA